MLQLITVNLLKVIMEIFRYLLVQEVKEKEEQRRLNKFQVIIDLMLFLKFQQKT